MSDKRDKEKEKKRRKKRGVKKRRGLKRLVKAHFRGENGQPICGFPPIFEKLGKKLVARSGKNWRPGQQKIGGQVRKKLAARPAQLSFFPAENKKKTQEKRSISEAFE